MTQTAAGWFTEDGPNGERVEHVGVIQTWAQGPGLRHGTVIVLPRSVGVTFVLVRLPWLARVMTSAVSRFYIIPILYSDAVTLSLYHIFWWFDA